MGLVDPAIRQPSAPRAVAIARSSTFCRPRNVLPVKPLSRNSVLQCFRLSRSASRDALMGVDLAILVIDGCPPYLG
jgi:hypothetical protein